jgi:hypothetical protein
VGPRTHFGGRSSELPGHVAQFRIAEKHGLSDLAVDVAPATPDGAGQGDERAEHESIVRRGIHQQPAGFHMTPS